MDEGILVAVRSGPSARENVRGALEGACLPPIAGLRVLVKPNAGRLFDGGSGVVSSPGAAGAVMEYVLSRRPRDIAVGDSPILGVESLAALEVTGIAAEARRLGVRTLDMDAPPAREVPFRGEVLDLLRFCGPIADFDLVISLAVAKTHMHTTVSLSLKNMKGILRGREKVRLHQLPAQAEHPGGERPLDIAIADLSTVLPRTWGVVDATVGLEGLGPSAGTPRRGGFAAASSDILACDITAARLMGFDPRSIRHLILAAGRRGGMPKIRTDPADLVPLVRPFEPAPASLDVSFPGVTIIDEDSCSACQSTLLLFLKNYRDVLVEYGVTGLTFAMGKVTDAPPGAVLLGNCTGRCRDTGVFIAGCPPVSSDILRRLTGLEPNETGRPVR